MDLNKKILSEAVGVPVKIFPIVEKLYKIFESKGKKLFLEDFSQKIKIGAEDGLIESILNNIIEVFNDFSENYSSRLTDVINLILQKRQFKKQKG